MSNIQQMLNKRQTQYNELTVEILHTFDDNLTKAVQMLMTMNNDIEWKTIDTIHNSPHFVALIGKIVYNIGDKIILTNGNEAVIDENNLNSFPSMIRVVTSLDSLNRSDEYINLFDELSFVNDMSSKLTEGEINYLLQQQDFVNRYSIELPKYKAYRMKLLTMLNGDGDYSSNEPEFDMKILDEAKASVYKLFADSNYGTKH